MNNNQIHIPSILVRLFQSPLTPLFQRGTIQIPSARPSVVATLDE
jgi:hypothetical protein